MKKEKEPFLVLAVDIGTSSLRTALFDAAGNRIVASTSQVSYPLRVARDGTAVLDPALLWKSANLALQGTLDYQKSRRELRALPIRAVGGSCFWHSFLGLNAPGEAVTPIYTWADTRCREDAAQLRKKFSEEEVHARTGCMLRASFWPAKMRWLKRSKPGLFASVKFWISPADWLWMRWTGQKGVGVSMASGTGFFNPHLLRWDAGLLKYCGLREESLGTVSDSPIAGTHCPVPELRSAHFYPALGDGAASNLGSGALRPDLAAINFGTSGAVRVILPSLGAKVPFGLFCYRVDAERYLVGGAISNAGNLRAWCLRELKLDADPIRLEAILKKEEGRPHGLTVLPFWVGERAPTWCEDLPGTIVGLNPSTTAVDLLRACTEATYQRLAQIAGLLPAPKKGRMRFVVSGGIQKSAEAVQRMASVLDRALLPSGEPEASIRGAAVFALERSGAKIQPAQVLKAVRPQPGPAKIYREQRLRQIALEKMMSLAAY